MLHRYAKGDFLIGGSQHEAAQFVDEAWRLLTEQDADQAVSLLGDTKKHSLGCIEEICRADFGLQAGTAERAASFQRSVVPLLRLVTAPQFLNSPLSALVNPVLARVASSLSLRRVAACLREVCRNGGSVADPRYRARPGEDRWAPSNWLEAAQPVAAFLYHLVTKFPQQLADRSTDVADCLAALQELAARPGAAAVPGAQLLQKQLEKLGRSLGHHLQMEERAAHMEVARRDAARSRADWQAMFGAADGGEGPGVHRREGPRHSNDHADIRSIDLAPTQDEVTCRIAPYLPKNRPGLVAHLPAGSPQAHLDLHFRLLRHDIVGPLYYVIQAYQDMDPAARAAQRGAGRYRFAQQGGPGALQGDLYFYEGVTVVNVVARPGAEVHFMVEFEEPAVVRRMAGSSGGRADFWERSKRLAHGTLVCLSAVRAAGPGQPAEERMVFGTVAHREPKELARTRPMLGISVSFEHHREDDAAFLLRLLTQHSAAPAAPDDGGGRRGRGAGRPPPGQYRVTMMQSGGSFFAYAPILRALQGMTEVPLEEFLAAAPVPPPAGGAAAGAGIKVEPPEYLASGSVPGLDLSVLISPQRAAQLAEPALERHRRQLHLVRARDPFPTQALLAATTLDDAQVAALQAALFQRISLIQGPPGTGKTYVGIQLMRVLLASPVAKPILCVCFTNHALDQFLEGILDAGVAGAGTGGIIRVGGRSQSARLQSCTLMEVGKGKATHVQRSLQYEARTRRKAEAEAVQVLVERSARLRGCNPRWEDVNVSVRVTARQLHSALDPAGSFDREQDGEGWEVVGDPSAYKDRWGAWVHARDLRRRRTVQLAPPPQGPAPIQAGGGQFDALAALLGADGFAVQDLQAMLLQQQAADAAGQAVAAPAGAAEASTVQEQVIWEDIPSDDEELAHLPNRARPLAQLLRIEDPWMLQERRALVAHWCAHAQEDLLTELWAALRRFNKAIDLCREADQAVDRAVLSQASVIGMTTSGVAAKQALIAAVGPKVVVCEEAAEVLEAHVLASLSPQTEQLVLIGDHEQLRPKVETYMLAADSGRGYNLDVSLFERLVKQRSVPVHALAEQHRMRPEISQLIRSTIYPQLRDHPRVLEYPPVRGMRHSLFFLAHQQPEGGQAEESDSKYNTHEAGLVVRLARYMLQQGYPASQVTILTPYLGQLRLIRRELGKLGTLVCLDDRDAEELAQLEEQEAAAATAAAGAAEVAEPAAPVGGSPAAAAAPGPASPLGSPAAGAARRMAVGEAVRLATIDNFQGEESTIVIISLVRSNKANDIGFLRRQNRVNVLLSRAKHGMFLVGNPACLTGGRNGDSMWARILPDLEAQGLVGPSLPLCCQKHPETCTPVASGRDFDDLVAEGGCQRNCGERMGCGHACPRQCHPDDPDHAFTRAACMEPCLHIHESCGHPCPLRCSQPCGQCRRTVAQVPLPCGHVARSVPCFRAQQPEEIVCCEPVEVTMPHCGHSIRVPCHKRSAIQAAPWECSAACQGELACGHLCSATCGQCFASTVEQQLKLGKPLRQQAVQLMPDGHTLLVGSGSSLQTISPLPSGEQLRHATCRERCSRDLFCGHMCGGACHVGQPCPPCPKQCTVRCSHSKCGKQCHEVCAPCAHECRWSCSHQGACPLPCAAPCIRLPCDRRCERTLPCGHRCPSVCGERCPGERYCIECGDPQLSVSDLLMAEEVSLLKLTQEQVDEEPLVVLPCGHAFLMGGLDELLELEWRERSSPEGGGSEMRGCYVRGSDGAWLEPAPLQERMNPAKTCPLCRAPLGQLLRYGRALNKQQLGVAQRKFLAAVSGGLQAYNASLADLQGKVEAAAGRTTGSGALSREQLGALLRHGQSLRKQFLQLAAAASSGNPGTRVHQAARASLLLRADEAGQDGSEVDAQLATLVMPRPDVTQCCAALLGQARTCLQLVQVAGMEVQACAAGFESVGGVPAVPGGGRGGRGGRGRGGRGGRGAAAGPLSRESASGWMRSAAREGLASLAEGLRLAVQVQQLAGTYQARRTQGSAVLVQAQLLVARVALLRQLQHAAVRQLLGPDMPEGAEPTQADAALQEAEAACKAGLQLVERLPGGEPALRSALRQMLDKLASMKQEITQSELRSVVSALVSANPGLSNQGWNGQGHFFECPNGHPYIITECGGMRQDAACPECGARIGGTSYRLAERNRPSERLRALVHNT